ncbi:MAG: hypothetical protein WAW23_08040, partial [Candidatus Methanoperedens sp.]
MVTFDEAFKQMKEEKGWNDDMLRILVFSSDGKNYSGHFRTEFRDVYDEVDERIKISLEIVRWIEAIGNAENASLQLKDLSPALSDLCTHRIPDAKRAMARTLRMLLFFQALVLARDSSEDLISRRYLSPDLMEEASRLLNGCSQLKDALDDILNTRIQVADTQFYMYLPLALIVAIAESQCDYFRPALWEAYSAGRAKTELRSKWPELPSDYLDIIILFIRYQSATGQWTRGTGDNTFISKCEDVAKRSGLRPAVLRTALKVIAVVEEARNHKLPGYESSEALQIINEGVDRRWGKPTWFVLTDTGCADLVPLEDIAFRSEDQLLEYAHQKGIEPRNLTEDLIKELAPVTLERNVVAIFDPARIPLNRTSKYTWSFATSLVVPQDDMIAFQELVQRREIQDGRNIVAFSFGRKQTEDLKNVISTYIRKAKVETEFDKYFYTRLLRVPDCFRPGNAEEVIEVFLNDHLAAEQLLFAGVIDSDNPTSHGPFGNTATYHTSEHDIERSAGELFIHLLKHAKEAFQLEKDTLTESKDRRLYMPTPLLKRIIEVVYRLRPNRCLSIPITFDAQHDEQHDEQHQEIVHIPQGLCKEDHKTEIELIANYLHAVVLNRAMSVGFRKCDIGLAQLNFSSSQGNPHEGKECDHCMTPAEWSELIDEFREINGYPVLVEKYLRDYNTERENVEYVPFRASLSLRNKISDLDERLDNYLTNQGEWERSLFLGIDIGATLTKFQFYQFSGRDGSFHDVGSSFRMLTFDQNFKSLENESPRQIFERRLREFSDRIVDTVSRNIRMIIDLGIIGVHGNNKDSKILAIGISWPGPVRNNRVAGTSKILSTFPPILSDQILDNKIESIMNLDIVNAFKTAWSNASLGEVPFVTLLNDGNA